jgi:hypothetical protein
MHINKETAMFRYARTFRQNMLGTSPIRLTLLAFLVFTACTGAPATSATSQPAETPPVAETAVPTPFEEEIVVENVSLQIMESFPVQVTALVRGTLPDACSFIEAIQQQREGEVLKVTLSVARRPDMRCAPQSTPFEQNIPLDVLGLPAGQYIVDVHGLRSIFELTVDNAPPPIEEPGGWRCGDYGRPDPCNNWLFGADMPSETEAWAVGLNGTILHWQEGVWSKATSPVTESLRAVKILSPNDGWIASEMGIILHWDGKVWREFPTISLPTGSLLDLEMLSPNEGWAVGGATSLGEFSALLHFSKD